MDFMINNTSFLEPCVRQLQEAVSAVRFFTGKETFIFDANIETKTMYHNDFYMILPFKFTAKITQSFVINSMKGKIAKILLFLLALFLL